MATLTALPHVTDPDLLFGAFEITASTARSRYATAKGRLRTALVSARGIHQEAVVLGQSCSGLRATAPMHGPGIARAPIDTEFARRARICSGHGHAVLACRGHWAGGRLFPGCCALRHNGRLWEPGLAWLPNC